MFCLMILLGGCILSKLFWVVLIIFKIKIPFMKEKIFNSLINTKYNSHKFIYIWSSFIGYESQVMPEPIFSHSSVGLD